MADQNVLFIQVRDPTSIRRTLLGCSKQVIQLLQRYEKLKEMRVKKAELTAKLRSTNKEITLLTIKLNTYLPAAATKTSEKIEKGKRKEPHQKSEQTRIEETHTNDLAKLEAELARIDSKIKQIS
jgi:methionyl-tRNA synthetase